MKKVNFKNKLSLNKETVAKLNDDQMNGVMGGSASRGTCISGCASGCVTVCAGTCTSVYTTECCAPATVNCSTM